MNIAKYIDHTLLKPTCLNAEIDQLCQEAVTHGFAAVCIPPPFVKRAKANTSKSGVKTATVIGFPFGYSNLAAKMAEAIQAIEYGADELDIVINLIALKNGAWEYLETEMGELANQIHAHGRVLKVIIESGILTVEEIIRCCKMYTEAGADYVKTSTGYAEKGASLEDVRLMRRLLPHTAKIKASGGIRSFEFAMQMIEAGADRLGTSAGLQIIAGQPSDSDADY